MSNKKTEFRTLGAVVEIPDLHAWVSDDGTWGVGELVIVNAEQWTDADWYRLAECPANERWELAVSMASTPRPANRPAETATGE